jgi:hypothetical protein
MSVLRVVWIRSLPAGRQQAAGSRSGAVTGGITLASFGEISRLGTTKMRLISAAVDYPDRRPTPRIPVLRAGTPMIDSNTRVRVEFSRRTRTSQRSRFHDETLTTEERMERHLKRPRAVEPEGRYYLHVRRTRRRCGRRRGSGGRDSHSGRTRRLQRHSLPYRGRLRRRPVRGRGWRVGGSGRGLVRWLIEQSPKVQLL